MARKISTIAPGTGWKSFFTSSGTEANEMAILAARCFTGSSDIIALRHSYHGRSSLAMGLTGQASWKLGPPVQAGITFAHNAYCYRCPFGLTYPDCEVRCAQDVGELIRTTTTGQIAGMIAEPIQGVGGFITPPKEYFKIVSKIVREYRRRLHQRRSADRLGPHRKPLVGHRSVGRHAGYRHQRQGPGERIPHRPDRGSPGSRR